MVRRLLGVVAVAVSVSATTVVSGDTVFRSALHDYRLVTVADALVQPWSIAFLPGGDQLITERPGRLRIVRQGKLLPQAVEGVPPVFHSSQGGLLEVMPHPNFAANRLLYLSYSKPGAEDSLARTALIRGRFENDRLTNVEQLFEAVARGRNHFSGKIAFDRNGFVFLSLGDRQVPPEGNLEAHPAQDLTNHHGKIIRLHDDGRVPMDNPFVSPGRRAPGDLELRPSQRPGARNPSRDRRSVGERARPSGRGRGEPHSARPQLRLAGDRLRRELHDRAGDSFRDAPSGHGAAAAGVDSVDRDFRNDVLYRRSVPAVEGQHVRGRDGRGAHQPAYLRRAADYRTRNADRRRRAGSATSGRDRTVTSTSSPMIAMASRRRSSGWSRWRGRR